MTKATELRELASLTTIASGQIQFDTDVMISGDLLTSGNTITISADELNIEDKNITLASGSANSAVADGAGITIDGAGATLNYVDSTGAMTFNTHLSVYDGGGGNGELSISRTGGATLYSQAQSALGRFGTSTNHDLQLMTNNGGRVTIDTNGNVGIATSTPQYNLDISGTGFRLADSSGVNDIKMGIYGGITMGGNGTGIRGIGTDSNEEMRITQNNVETIKIERNTRHVIIGNDTSSDSPAHQLDVVGDINARESFRTDQVRHSIRPTLNLDFANSKELDPRITFYRDSIATYYDSKGVLRYANTNTPRFDHDPVTGESKGLLIEESRTNTLLSPFNTLTGANATLRFNSHKGLDGRYTAYSMTRTASTGSNDDWEKNGSISFTADTMLLSIYAKPIGGGQQDCDTFMWSFQSINGAIVRFGFTLSGDGDAIVYTAGNGGHSASIEAVQDGWYRCKAVVNAQSSGATTQFLYALTGYSEGSGCSVGDGLILWGGQLEAGAFPTSYIPSDTRFTSRSSVATYHDENGILRTAPANSPRYGYKYDGRKWVETGLILENAATNLAKYSTMQFTNTWSIPSNAYSYGSTTTAPDGSTIKAISKNSEYNIIRQGNVFDNTVTKTYTFSIWAKLISGNGQFTVDLGDSATTLMGFTATGEWQRFEATVTYEANDTPYNFLDIVMQDNSEVALWGIQLEEGYVATSYIHTHSAALTRSADVASSVGYTRAGEYSYIDGKDFEEFYNEDEGTVHVNYQLGEKLSSMRVMSFHNANTSAEYLDVVAGYGAPGLTTKGPYFFGPMSIGPDVSAAGSQLTNVANTNIKFTGRIKENDYYAVSDNTLETQIGTQQSAGIPSPTRMTIGGDFGDNNSQRLCGHIRKIAYYPEALTDAEIQALTENN